MATEIQCFIPPGWEIRNDSTTEFLVRARPHHHTGGVPPEIVVRSQPVDEELATWRRDALAALETQLDDFELEDEDAFDLGVAPAHYHRFAHRMGTADLLTEQWAWLVHGVGVTLTCTVERADYIAYCELFEDVAETVEVLRPVA